MALGPLSREKVKLFNCINIAATRWGYLNNLFGFLKVTFSTIFRGYFLEFEKVNLIFIFLVQQFFAQVKFIFLHNLNIR